MLIKLTQLISRTFLRQIDFDTENKDSIQIHKIAPQNGRVS